MLDPTHSSQVLVTQVNRATVSQWIRDFGIRRPNSVLLLIGPSGCGMSTLASLCLKEQSYDIVEVNAASYGNRKELKKLLQNCLHVPWKTAVFVEEPEFLSTDGGLIELAEFAKKRSRVPVVAVCNRNKRPKVESLVSGAIVVNFTYLPRAVLIRHFGDLPDNITNGDIRQIVIQLRSALRTQRDFHTDLTATASQLLSGRNLSEKFLFSHETNALINLIHENFLHSAKDARIAAMAAHDISSADILNNGETQDHAYVVGTVMPGWRLQAQPGPLRSDVVWTKQTHALARSRNLQSVKACFQAAGTVLDVYSLGAVREKLLQAGSSGCTDEVIKWAPDATIPQMLGVMRLGVGVKSRAQHNQLGRMRRLLTVESNRNRRR